MGKRASLALTIETPNWNIDKFGTATSPVLYSDKIRVNDESYTPIEGETLQGYCRRMASLIQKLENTSLDAHTGRAGKKMWFTHRTPSSCWICDHLNVMWFLYETMNLVANTYPNAFFTNESGKLIIKTS